MSNLNYFFANAEVKDDAVIKLRDDNLVVFKRAQQTIQSVVTNR